MEKKKVRHYSSYGAFLGQYDSAADAAKKEGISPKKVSSYCLGKTTPKDRSMWFYVDDITFTSTWERMRRIAKAHRTVYVMQYTKEGEFVRDYVTISCASKITGISETAIINATKGRSKTAGGYIWRRIV